MTELRSPFARVHHFDMPTNRMGAFLSGGEWGSHDVRRRPLPPLRHEAFELHVHRVVVRIDQYGHEVALPAIGHHKSVRCVYTPEVEKASFRYGVPLDLSRAIHQFSTHDVPEMRSLGIRGV